MRRTSLVVLLAVVGLLAVALPAKACSCFQGDPRDQFDKAEAAIVGEYVGARPTEDPDDYEAIYTFNVQEEWKVDFGDTLDVHSADNGAACGIEASPGQDVGLFLTMQGDQWHSNLCSQTSARGMRDAASPLPEPNGTGAPRMVVGGSFGKARVLSMDSEQRTLAYGFGGNHDTTRLDACPGGKRFVEVWQNLGSSKRGFAVRRTSDLHVVSEATLPSANDTQLGGLDCRKADGSRALVFSAKYYGRADGVIHEIEGDRVNRLFGNFGASYADFGETHAYLSGRNRLMRVDLRTGVTETLLKVVDERNVGAIALSPTGSNLAAIIEGSYEPSRDTRIALVRLSDDRIRTKEVAEGVTSSWLEWAGARRLVMLTSGERGGRVFDMQLDTVSKLPPWYSSAFVVHRGRIWSASYGELVSMDLSGGSVRSERRLPSPVNNDLIEIPKATRD